MLNDISLFHFHCIKKIRLFLFNFSCDNGCHGYLLNVESLKPEE